MNSKRVQSLYIKRGIESIEISLNGIENRAHLVPSVELSSFGRG